MKPTFDDIKGMTFATTYNWSVDIREINSNKGLTCMTATSVTEDVGLIEEKNFKIGPVTLNIPEGVGPRIIQITFLDKEDSQIFTYLKDWYDKFFSYDSGYVGTLTQVSKRIKIRQYSIDGEVVWNSREYLVYPQGTLQYKGTSDPDLFSVTVNLRIVEFKL